MTQDQIQEELIKKGVKFFQNNQHGYFDVAMRVGKCRITIEIIKELFNKDPYILLAYPDNKLEQTWKDEFSLWEYETPNIKYTNFSSLKKYKDEKYDIVIIDEFHSASPLERDYCHQIMTNQTIGGITIALSGTVSKETTEEWGLKEIASYSTLEGIQAGILSDYQITVHLIDLDTKVKAPNKKGKLLTEKQKYDNLTYVINAKREKGENTMFLALARNRLSLSSIGKIQYAKNLLKKLKDKRTLIFTGLADVADQFMHSYHSKSTNDSHYEAFMNKRINFLALAAMGKMGVTYPDLDSVILLNFTYNAEESSQILNRAIKLDYHGKVADLHVLCLNEPPEIRKIKESLSMLDKTKIKYIYGKEKQ